MSIDNQPPAKPSLSLGKLTESYISLSFESTDNIGVVRYELFKNGSSFRTITNANSFVDSNIDYNRTYVYYVIAYDGQGNASERSDELTISTERDVQPPEIISVTTPKNLYSGNAIITVRARDNNALSKVFIQVSSDGITWIDAGFANALGRAEEAVNITVDTTVFADGLLRLRAYAVDTSDNISNAEDSPIHSITVDNTAPNAPFGLTSDISNGRIIIRWNFNQNDNDISHFRIYRKASNEATFRLVRDNHKFIDFSDNNIQLGLEYTYRVTAVDQAGNESDYSSEITVIIDDDTTPPQILSMSPATGSKIPEYPTLSIACYDNLMLESLTIEYRKSTDTDWQFVAHEDELNAFHLVVAVDIDTTDFVDGMYQFRAKATDHAGNESDYFYAAYNFRICTLSEPEVTAAGKGWSVDLSWTMTNTQELIGYNIFKRTATSQNYSRLASITGRAFTDNKVTAGERYFYVIEAVDSYGNIVSSVEVSAVPTHEDNINPIADAGSDLQGIAGKSVSFDGSRSWDNHHIASYLWDFGDGNSSVAVRPSHTYANEGIYTVTLTVRDSAGNSDSHAIKVLIYSPDYSVVRLHSNVPFANIFNDELGIDVFADSAGNYDLIVKSGEHDFYLYANGYAPQMVSVNTNAASVKVNLVKTGNIDGEIKVRQLEIDEIIALGIDISDPDNQFVFEYTYQVNYNGKTDTVTFRSNVAGETPTQFNQTVHVGGQTFTDSSGNTVFQQTGVIGQNWNTTVMQSIWVDCGSCAGCIPPPHPSDCDCLRCVPHPEDCDCFRCVPHPYDCDCQGIGNPCQYSAHSPDCSCGRCKPPNGNWNMSQCQNQKKVSVAKTIAKPPVVFFRVTQYTSWLKEFYEVELIVNNNVGDGFTIENAIATINLPDGLSLADTARAERGTINMGTIEALGKQSASWIIRGDKAGSYDVSADFTGILMPFGEDVEITFMTSEPIVVLGGDALKFEITHDGFAQDKLSWNVDFTLTNISEKPIHNVQFDFAGAIFAYQNADIYITDMTLFYPCGTMVVIPWNDGARNEPNYHEAEEYLPIFGYDPADSTLILESEQSIRGNYTVWFNWNPD